MTQISDDTPAYNEQAIFTPDMKTVIMMSNRGKPQSSWYDLVVSAAMRTGFDAPNTGADPDAPVPVGFRGTRLQLRPLRRRPEDESNQAAHALPPRGGSGVLLERRLLKIIIGVETKGATNVDLPTWIGRFEGISNQQRQVPRHIPVPGLEGTPVNMARVGSQAQAIPGPGTNRQCPFRSPVPAPAPSGRYAGQPRTTDRRGTSTVPSVTATYLGVWLNDLAKLSQLAGQSFVTPPLLGSISPFG